MAFFGPIITIKHKEKKITKTEKKFGCKDHPEIGYWISGMKFCPICGKEMNIFEHVYEDYANVKDIFDFNCLHKIRVDEKVLVLCDELEYERQTEKDGYTEIDKNINTTKLLKDFMQKYKKGIKFLDDNKFDYSIDIALVKERRNCDDD